MSPASSPARPRTSRERLPRAGALALAAILAVAAALRATGIQYGLPYGNLLNPDEQSIVPRAWAMVHGGGLDPRWFDYPTLVIYLQAPFQAWHAAPSFLTARVVVLVLALAAIWTTWWLGRRAYGPGAGLVGAAALAVATVHADYSRMAVTDVPLTLGVAAALGLALAGRLEWAGLAAGLATGAKYPGVFLVVPLLVAGWRQPRRLAVALALGAAAFVATSPFILVHPHQAYADATRVQDLAKKGWLGFEDDPATPIAFVERLWHGLGPLLVVAGAGLVLALWRRSRADLVLASFAVVYFLDLLTLHAHFDRYTLPLLPVLGVLAGRVVQEAAGRSRGARVPAGAVGAAPAAVALALLAVPLWWSADAAARLTRTDTRVVAARWIAANIPQGAAVAAESSTPPLPGRRVLALQLPGPGVPFDTDRDLARLRAKGIQYVIVSGAVADRVLRARARYPREAALYDDLARGAGGARRVYELRPGSALAGPWVAVYRL